MTRNILLTLTTLGIVALLFVGYVQLTAVPIDGGDPDRHTRVSLPQPASVPSEALAVGPIEVPPGGEFAFTVYDERTGRETDRFRCAQWRKAPGSDDEVLVTSPELTMRLPSGMIATITAQTGRVTVDRIDTRRMRPRLGWLAGEARIRIDRETSEQRTPLADRPADAIDIRSDRLTFDLEVGKLQFEGPLQVVSDEFSIAGTGLELVWNQIGNRVERLTIHRGELLTLRLSGREPAQPGASIAQSQPASAPAEVPDRAPRPSTTYVLTLSGDVQADHWRGDARVGGLRAREIALLFDTAGDALPVGGASAASAPTAAASAPATQPSLPERLAIRWSGPLELSPIGTRDPSLPPRRQLDAFGETVTLESSDARILCGGLRYEDHTQRAWLRPPPGGRVALALSDRLSVETTSVFIDRAVGLVKLIGDVSLRSGAGESALSMSCDLWAELRLAKGERPADGVAAGLAPDGMISAAALRSALFVGDVRVLLRDRRLAALRLETFFQEGQAGDDLEALLDSAVASGEVRFVADRGEMLPGWLLVPARRVAALGRLAISGDPDAATVESQRLSCAWMKMGFSRDAAGRAFVRDIEAVGAVRLSDRESGVSAQGNGLTAVVSDGERITRASVRGSRLRPARIAADPYVVWGERVHFDEPSQSMLVDGASRLRFSSDLSLRGARADRARPIDITSRDALRVDGARNTITFRGAVDARSGAERLRAETLTLQLEDLPAPPAAPPGPLEGLRRAVADARRGAPGVESASASGEVSGSSRSRSVRKRPVRLLAQQAVIESETYASGDPRPLVHQSIAAPDMQVNIAERILRTAGETTLLMISRQLDAGADAAREATGLPSALMSKGPSQTAMKCSRSMTYALGEDGPSRRDGVLFEGDVKFRHVAGRQVVGLEELLPEFRTNPDLLKTLKDRNTFLECDRLEGALTAGGGANAAAAAAGSSGLRMTSLNALGSVYLRDEQGTTLREVHAHQIEFDRVSGKVRVLGNRSDGRAARVYSQDAARGRFDNPADGMEFVIDLNSNTVTAGAVSGEFRRP